MAYVYRFVNSSDKVIYYGKTSQSMDKRMSQHWKNGHLSKQCYDSVVKIEYQKCKSESDALILETYFITRDAPKYNKLQQSKDTPTFKLEEGKWKLYKELKPVKVIRCKTSILWKVIAFIYLIFAMCYILGIK